MRAVLDRMEGTALEHFKETAFEKLSQMKTEKGIPYPAKVVIGVVKKS